MRTNASCIRSSASAESCVDKEECPEQPFALGLVELLERERDPEALR